MELSTALRVQPVPANIRTMGINPNHWYAVGWAQDWSVGQVKSVQLWDWPIAIYRGENGQLHALANRCPHRGVALQLGTVKGDRLACRYHGWEFAPTGECARIPYWLPTQKLPHACARAYPIQEQYGLVWVFPGQATLATTTPLIDIPEFTEPDWLRVPVSVYFKAHFSICNENTMDVFHGVLHEDLQGWFDPVLEHLTEDASTVRATYRVSYQGYLPRLLGLAQEATAVTTNRITIEYRYPHYRSTMPGISALYLMRLPIAPTESRSFAWFFFKAPLVQRLPPWLKAGLSAALRRFVLHRFIAQDKAMVESEQQAFLSDPHHPLMEVNPAILAVQRLIRQQYAEFVSDADDADDADNAGDADDAGDRPGAGHKPTQNPVLDSKVDAAD